jgi:hypothetical protein
VLTPPSSIAERRLVPRWFQPLHLRSENPVSKFAFRWVSSYRYITVTDPDVLALAVGLYYTFGFQLTQQRLKPPGFTNPCTFQAKNKTGFKPLLFKRNLYRCMAANPALNSIAKIAARMRRTRRSQKHACVSMLPLWGRDNTSNSVDP